MRTAPDYLSRRYNAVDDLINHINDSSHSQNDSLYSADNPNNAGVKLMCDFWRILKDNPNYNLPKEVRRIYACDQVKSKSCMYGHGPRQYWTYMADQEDKQPPGESSNPQGKSSNKDAASPLSIRSIDDPLNKAVNNINEAASVDKTCQNKLNDLLVAQTSLKEQIQGLENKEKEGVDMLKEADAMWLCMEEAYKKKIAQASEDRNVLIEQVKEIELSTSKWRKNKKDLLYQIKNMEKVKRDITDEMNQKKNDLRIIEIEIDNLQKRKQSNTTDLENVNKSMASKRSASDAKMASLSEQMAKLQKKTTAQLNSKKLKEDEGAMYVKDARNDLQQLCKVLIKKKLENEDLRAEKKGLLDELNLLNTSASTCKARCDAKEQALRDEIMKLSDDIENYKVKCLKCHVCTDTNDTRKLCTDCPRCLNERDCIYESDCCSSDPTMDCVCMAVKQKFLDNVFENMYTVLEQQSKTCPGKAVADVVLDSLKRSRNGKLSPDARKILQDFILTTVKKHLNLTIIGGAVKTRCEMDPETYKQLMYCLNDIVVTKPDSVSVGTASKKDPCSHWGGTSECQCPRGPKSCVCTKKAPPPVGSDKPLPCDKEDAKGPTMVCPGRAPKPCSADCGNQGKGNPSVAIDVAKWRPDPCSTGTCTYSRNMRTQYMLNNGEIVAETPIKGAGSTTAVMDMVDRTEKSNSSNSETPLQTTESDSKCDCIVVMKNTKQLKEIGTSYHDITHRLQFVKQKLRKSPVRRNLKSNPISIKPISDFARTTINKNKKEPNSINELFASHKYVAQEVIYKNFKIIIDNYDGKRVVNLAALTKTASGNNIIELDEEFNELLENKINDRPYMYVSLNQTKSGQFLLDFDNKDDQLPILQKIILSRTPSGTNVLEMQKQIFDIIQDIDIEKKEDMKRSSINKPYMIPKASRSTSPPLNESSKLNKYRKSKQYSKIKNISDMSQFESKNTPLVYIKLRRINKINDRSNFSLSEGINKKPYSNNKSDKKINFILKEVKNSQTSISNMSEASESRTYFQNYSQEFEESYENGNVITLNIENDNAFFKKLETFVSKTPSGTLYINLSKSLKVIPLSTTNPVYLSKIKSDNYLLKINNYTKYMPNAVLKKCPTSGHVMLIPVVENVNCNEDEKFYKVKIVGNKGHPVSLPMVLNATESGNYIIIWDKEFEKRYKKTVQDYIGTEDTYLLLLKKTSSGYLIDLNTNGTILAEETNALLVKSSSGEIKVLVKGPAFEFVDNGASKRSSLSSAQVFESLLDKLQPVSSREIHREKLRKSKFISQKCNSDTEFYERVKIKLHINKKLLSDTAAIVKKSKSGQYSLILDKDSKKVFINNLRHYLASNPNGLEPIEKTASGHIIIRMNSMVEGQEHCGSIKITPSGNIYILADKETLNEKSTKGGAGSKSSSSADSKPVESDTIEVVTKDIQSVPVSCKGVTTTSHGHPAQFNCEVTKCAYSELNSEDLALSCLSKEPKNEDFYGKDINSSMANLSDSSSISTLVISSDTGLKPGPDSKPGKEPPAENCYFVFDTACSYHKYRYDYNLSNDLLTIPEYSDDTSEEFTRSTSLEDNVPVKEAPIDYFARWDSLQYMPPQLPHFLRSAV